MLIERIWAANDLRNFHYLIACAETGEALIVDPLDAQQCLDAARARGFTITQVLNTHEHRDHTDGNAGVVAATGAKVLAHAGAASIIGGVDRGLNRGDVIRIGRTVELEALDTPGHTRSHVCLFAHGEIPALFCGDTLFNAGAGNCHHGGAPELLYQTFVVSSRSFPTTLAFTQATNTWRATWPSRWIASLAIVMRRRCFRPPASTTRRQRGSPRSARKSG